MQTAWLYVASGRRSTRISAGASRASPTVCAIWREPDAALGGAQRTATLHPIEDDVPGGARSRDPARRPRPTFPTTTSRSARKPRPSPTSSTPHCWSAAQQLPRTRYRRARRRTPPRCPLRVRRAGRRASCRARSRPSAVSSRKDPSSPATPAATDARRRGSISRLLVLARRSTGARRPTGRRHRPHGTTAPPRQRPRPLRRRDRSEHR